MSKHKTGSMCLIVLFLTIIMVTFQPTLAESSDHDTLIISAELGGLTHLDGRKHWGRVLTRISTQYQGYLGMIAPGKTAVTMPGIAESWTHNEDYTEWTITIQEGARLHNGDSIDAKSVRYSIYANLMIFAGLDNLSEAVNSKFIEVSYTADDPKGDGRRIILSGDFFPNPSFELGLCGGRIGGFPHDERILFVLVPYESHGRYTDTTEVCQNKSESFSQHPIFAGPYKLKFDSEEFNIDNKIILERFDDWFGWGHTIPASNGKNYTFPSQDSAFKYIHYIRSGDIKTGELDLTPHVLDYTLEELNDLNNKEGFSVDMKASIDCAPMAMNIQGDWPTFFGGPGNFPVSQVWFRQAISHAINRTNIVNDAFNGLVTEYDSIFPDWILEDYPSIDTSDYYDFDQGKEEAVSILNSQGYTPLGFPDEPDNRFGWGLYANETSRGGVEQPRGRHFIMVAKDDVKAQSFIIKEELQQIGIYVDLTVLDVDKFWPWIAAPKNGGNPGATYNTSYINEPDPDYKGPSWDFLVFYSLSYPSESPGVLIWFSFIEWITLGGIAGDGWYNHNFELAFAKIWGNSENLLTIPWETVQDFPFPDWSNEDVQFIEACEDAGAEMSRELPFIPLVWYNNFWVFNSNLKNFIADREVRGGTYQIAYTYWDETGSKNAPSFEFHLIFTLIVLIIIHRNIKKRKH